MARGPLQFYYSEALFILLLFHAAYSGMAPDLPQQQAADILHCKRKVYRRYEKGIREFPLSYTFLLARHYKGSLNHLTGLTDRPPAEIR